MRQRNYYGWLLLFVTVLMIINGTMLSAQESEWLWARAAGGTENVSSQGIFVDESGNSYVVGNFTGNATFGNIELHSTGTIDAFVAKINSEGEWLWASRAGGSNVIATGIAIDKEGFIYITGLFSGNANFGGAEIQTEFFSMRETFVAKLNSAGQWLWANKASGQPTSQGADIVVDSSGNAILTGIFWGTGIFGNIQLSNSMPMIIDLYVAKIGRNGNWMWVRRATGTPSPYSLAIDNDDNIYLTGSYFEPVTFGNRVLQNSGSADVFAAKMNSSGTWLWAKGFGGTGSDIGFGIDVNDEGHSYVTGHFSGRVSFGETELVSAGNTDVFIVKLDNTGEVLWAEKIGGNGADLAEDIALDKYGNCFVTGSFTRSAVFGDTELQSEGNKDIFIAALSSNGEWLWASRAGGTEEDTGVAVAVDTEGNCYLTGRFKGTANFGSNVLNSRGNNDIFVSKLYIVTTDVDENELLTESVIGVNLGKNYPNPFNPETTIDFSINKDMDVKLVIYNLKGQLVKTLQDGFMPAGKHTVYWRGTDDKGMSVSSGIYYYRLITNSYDSVKKMLYLK